MSYPHSLPPDLVRSEVYAPNADLWHLSSAVWEAIWGQGIDGRKTVCAILDTGYVPHENLPKPIVERSFIRGEPVRDRNAHGTHVAGTAVGRDGIGVAPAADLIVGKVLSDSGSGSSQGIASGIVWATDEGADVISMSLGGGSSFGPTNAAIDRAFKAGRLVNAAAGNSGFSGGRNTIVWPAKHMGCLCNGATREDGRRASFSSGGRQMDWVTPGQNIWSASIRGGLTRMSGTSMATPYGSGLLCLIVQMMRQEGKQHWTAIESVREFFGNYCRDLGPGGHDPEYGWGVPRYTDIVESLQHKDVKWI